MSQIEIAEIIEQIKQEIEVDANGHGKASIKATARLAGVDDESIRKALKSSADLAPSKLAKELMLQGFSAADLSQWRTDGIPDIAIAKQANELYQHCLKLEWQQNQIRIAGKTMPVPRLECFYTPCPKLPDVTMGDCVMATYNDMPT
ncbi:hypothetical protein LC653_31530 [Nostoc sp. CHAB 5784]|uniref:hypothetical protein n=1 Tax=Nostoc mirabile TaxID=2907820 RepID=UPI001E453DA8|nr:hypothetical protein [Nostoc mirabile]MCC5668270.1 hypothetical protein [Nostoc mirabile CHAB5784]